VTESDNLAARPVRVQRPGEITDFRLLVAGFRTEVASLKAMEEQRDDRIAELERLLAEARCSGRRQVAPCLIGGPATEPKDR